MQAARPTTAEHGSRTITVTDAQPREDPNADGTSPSTRVAPQGGVLRLRGGPRNTQRVVWREDVIDNEGCGKKSSKICCIYHKPRAFDESSSESSSDSDSGDSRHHHPYPRPRRHNGHRHPRKPSSDSDHPSASSSAAGNTPHTSSSAMATPTATVTATSTSTGTQDPVHEQSGSDSENAYEARPTKRYKAHRAEGQRHS